MTVRGRAADAIVVPPAGSPWWSELDTFALTYNGYTRFEGDLGVFANEAKHEYMVDGVLPHDLHLLRCLLFFEQRRFRHLDAEPTGRDRDYIDDVMEVVRDLSGGSVPGPPDQLP